MNTGIKKKQISFIFLIFIAALLIRSAYIFQILQFPLTEFLVRSRTFDQYGFDTRAVSIFSGNWFGGSEVFGKEPLYSYFLALIYRLFGYNHFAVYFIQAIFTSLSVVLVYKISKHIFNNTAGYIAAFILAFYSVSIFYDAILLRASLITFLNMLLFYLILRAQEKDMLSAWFVPGMTMALSMLTRQNMLFPFIAFFILVTKRPLKVAVSRLAVFIIGMFIVLLPVLARNYIVSEHQRIAISSEVNAFWVGNTYNASGVDLAWSSEYHRMERESSGSLKKMLGIFLREVKERPRDFLALYTRKIWMFFNGYEPPSNTNYYLYNEEFPSVLRWPLFNFQLVGGLGILGVLLSLSGRKKPLLAYIFIGVLSVSVIFFHIQSRFRLPSVPFFIIFASYTIYSIFDGFRSRRFFKSTSILIMVIFLCMILRPDVTYAGFNHEGKKIRYFDRTNLALAYIDDYETHKDKKTLLKALRQCNIAIEQEKSAYLPYDIRGRIYLLEGRYADSIANYKMALVYHKRNAFLYNKLAGVYFEKRDYYKAFMYTKRALYLSSGNKAFENNLALTLQFLQ